MLEWLANSVVTPSHDEIESNLKKVDRFLFPPNDVSTPIPQSGCSNIIFDSQFVGEEHWIEGIEVSPPRYEYSETDNENRYVVLGKVVSPSGNEDNPQDDSTIRQLVKIPPNVDTAQLSWRYLPVSNESPKDTPLPNEDRQEIYLLGSDYHILRVLYRGRENFGEWQPRAVDLTEFIGQRFFVYFNAYNDGIGGRTKMGIDDVFLNVCFSNSR